MSSATLAPSPRQLHYLFMWRAFSQLPQELGSSGTAEGGREGIHSLLPRTQLLSKYLCKKQRRAVEIEGQSMSKVETSQAEKAQLLTTGV